MNEYDNGDDTAMAIVLLLLTLLAIGGVLRAIVWAKRSWTRGMDLLRRPRVRSGRRSGHPAE
jgi:hypothetical protein